MTTLTKERRAEIRADIDAYDSDHGHLALLALVALDEMEARAERAERERDAFRDMASVRVCPKCETRMEISPNVYRARAERAEAACAEADAEVVAYKAALEVCDDARTDATDAGAALLTERDALRAACEEYMREGDKPHVDGLMIDALAMGAK